MRTALPATLVLGVLVVATVAWSARPARAVATDDAWDMGESGAFYLTFSEERARPVVDLLAGEIGHRLAGSPGATRALDALAAEMRAIPGLEVEIQEVSSFAEGLYSGASLYTVRNLVARLPGESDESVFVAAHYDTPPPSVGAADDAIGVAAVVEIARCLASRGPLRRSVVFVLDEGEELGLFGARGFLHHRWAATTVAYLNLESAGARGRPILFQAGPGAAWTASAYGAAPHPHGTVLGQDVFQSGVIPSDTDFRVYRDAGLVGLDLALYRDGWAYHTHLDTPERLQPGSLQEMGENALAVVRELATRDIPSETTADSAVFWDILGTWWVTYDANTGLVLATLALLGLSAALVVLHRRGDVTVAAVVFGVLAQARALVAAVVVVALVAWTLAAFGRGHGWYARPWLAWPAYGGLVIAICSVVLRRAARSRPGVAPLVAGAGVVSATLLAAASFVGMGSAYIPLLWTAGGVAAALAVRRPALAILAGCLVPAIVTAQAGDALLETFAAIAGRLPAELDVPIALLAAFPFLFTVPIPLAFLAGAPTRAGRAALLVNCALGVASLVALAVVFPYTPDRPKRLSVSVLMDGRVARTSIASEDALAVDARRAPVSDPFGGADVPESVSPATLQFLGEEPAGDGARRVRVRVHPRGATGVVIGAPSDRIARIALPDRGAWEPSSERSQLTLIVPPDGLELLIDVIGDAPVTLPLRGWHADVPTAIQDHLATLPDWTTVHVRGWVSSSVDL